MDFPTATEMRKTSRENSHHIAGLVEISVAIQEAARKGRYQVVLKNLNHDNNTQSIIVTLQCCGYTVSKHKTSNLEYVNLVVSWEK